MGKLRILAVCLALMLCTSSAALAETAAPAPFTRTDVDQISSGFTTVGDYALALSPTSCSWEYQGAATGETYLTLYTESADGVVLGETTIMLALNDQLIDGLEEGKRETLPDGLQDKQAWLISAQWRDASYKLPCIRGVAPGAQQEDVVKAFFSNSAAEPDYSIKDINPAVDESWVLNTDMNIGASAATCEDGSVDYTYNWCTLDTPDEWREYYQLVYHIAGGTVVSIDLNYSTDPE